MLHIESVDSTVGGHTDKDIINGGAIGHDAKPGDDIQLKVRVENNYTTAEDIDIRSITVTGTIQGIDNGDDLEDDSSEFDLKSSRSKTVALHYKVPMIVDQDTFNIKIVADGRDVNGTRQINTINIALNVNKGSNRLLLTTAYVNPTTIKCQRSIQLTGEILNIGNNDQNHVTYQVVNGDIDLNVRQTDILMSKDTSDDTNKFDRTDRIQLQQSITPGDYPITFNAYYDTDRIAYSKTVYLIVQDCPNLAKSQQTQGATTTQPATTPANVITNPSEQVYPVPQEQPTSIFQNTPYLLLAGFAYVAVIAIGIILIVRALSKKK